MKRCLGWISRSPFAGSYAARMGLRRHFTVYRIAPASIRTLSSVRESKPPQQGSEIAEQDNNTVSSCSSSLSDDCLPLTRDGADAAEKLRVFITDFPPVQAGATDENLVSAVQALWKEMEQGNAVALLSLQELSKLISYFDYQNKNHFSDYISVAVALGEKKGLSPMQLSRALRMALALQTPEKVGKLFNSMDMVRFNVQHAPVRASLKLVRNALVEANETLPSWKAMGLDLDSESARRVATYTISELLAHRRVDGAEEFFKDCGIKFTPSDLYTMLKGFDIWRQTAREKGNNLRARFTFVDKMVEEYDFDPLLLAQEQVNYSLSQYQNGRNNEGLYITVELAKILSHGILGGGWNNSGNPEISKGRAIIAGEKLWRSMSATNPELGKYFTKAFSKLLNEIPAYHPLQLLHAWTDKEKAREFLTKVEDATAWKCLLRVLQHRNVFAAAGLDDKALFDESVDRITERDEDSKKALKLARDINQYRLQSPEVARPEYPSELYDQVMEICEIWPELLDNRSGIVKKEIASILGSPGKTQEQKEKAHDFLLRLTQSGKDQKMWKRGPSFFACMESLIALGYTPEVEELFKDMPKNSFKSLLVRSSDDPKEVLAIFEKHNFWLPTKGFYDMLKKFEMDGVLYKDMNLSQKAIIQRMRRLQAPDKSSSKEWITNMLATIDDPKALLEEYIKGRQEMNTLEHFRYKSVKNIVRSVLKDIDSEDISDIWTKHFLTMLKKRKVLYHLKRENNLKGNNTGNRALARTFSSDDWDFSLLLNAQKTSVDALNVLHVLQKNNVSMEKSIYKQLAFRLAQDEDYLPVSLYFAGQNECMEGFDEQLGQYLREVLNHAKTREDVFRTLNLAIAHKIGGKLSQRSGNVYRKTFLTKLRSLDPDYVEEEYVKPTKRAEGEEEEEEEEVEPLVKKEKYDPEDEAQFNKIVAIHQTHGDTIGAKLNAALRDAQSIDTLQFGDGVTVSDFHISTTALDPNLPIYFPLRNNISDLITKKTGFVLSGKPQSRVF